MPQVEAPGPFPDVRLWSPEGELSLSERWRATPLIVTFMRHFGCSFCREHLHNLSAADDRVRATGGRTIAIFQYEADATRDYCHGRGIEFECLGDPNLEAYAKLDLGTGSFRQLFGWKVIMRARSAYKVGGLGGTEGGDARLMPGTFVIDSDGGTAYAHYSANAADNPPVDDLVGALERLSTRI